MRENLETWPARREAAEAESGGVPAWVEGELRRYLECGGLLDEAATAGGGFPENYRELS